MPTERDITSWECPHCGRVNRDRDLTCLLCKKGKNPKAHGRENVRLSSLVPRAQHSGVKPRK